MSEKIKQMLDDFSVTTELTVKDINTLLNCLNMPSQMPATTAIYFINLFQNQAGPQVEKAKKDLETISQATKDE